MTNWVSASQATLIIGSFNPNLVTMGGTGEAEPNGDIWGAWQI
uniref:Uncharacterized protein n=1 Tax=Gloeothece verrucosa (strain PCC 7822) TaxID=497965 RepID=E0UGF0_GLOV7|nr:hypothetical protein [Gloeothece verrucosa]ADN16769.1 hypothetical protein Cyan7822_4878 [Gloeothece verrucosa PCC 7822]